jgi:sigma-B regulation protein RsbU (phosphoserine phosphatase)
MALPGPDITGDGVAIPSASDGTKGGGMNRSENEIASQIQRSILPGEVDIEGLEIVAAMQPTETVGGDYYDIIPVSDGCWIAIGDVAGHGLAAGLITLMIQSALQSLIISTPDASPADLVCSLNAMLYENVRRRMGRGEYVTFCLVRYWTDGRLAFAGGHEDIMISRETGAFDKITSPGCWLGVLPDIRSLTSDGFDQLGPRDVMVLYTDGITEARDAQGTMFGEAGLQRVIEGLNASSLAAIRDGVFAAVHAWSSTIDDDFTLVVMRCRGIYW